MAERMALECPLEVIVRFMVVLALASSIVTPSILAESRCHPTNFPPFVSERYLLPVYVPFPVDGALGSRWLTEVTLSNGSDVPVWVENVGSESTFGGYNRPVPPGVSQTLQFASLEITELPARFLEIEAGAREFAVQLRVRDVTRENLSYGAEIPVVHHSRATNDVINLAAIPISNQYRNLLRIYDFEQILGGSVEVRVYGVESVEAGPDATPDRLIAEMTLPFIDGACDQPGYIQVPIPGQSATGQVFSTVRVEVEPTNGDSRIWAMATLTNNTTQQVTVVSPK